MAATVITLTPTRPQPFSLDARPASLDPPIVPDLQGVATEALLVEDNPGDVRLTQEGFSADRLGNNPHVTTDGKEPLDFLHCPGGTQRSPEPDLVLLDLNLPKIDGHEGVRRMEEDLELKGTL